MTPRDSAQRHRLLISRADSAAHSIHRRRLVTSDVAHQSPAMSRYSAAPSFETPSRRDPVPFETRCALRLPCSEQGPDDLQTGLSGHADDALHGGVQGSCMDAPG